jgi:hypothetical protein
MPRDATPLPPPHFPLSLAALLSFPVVLSLPPSRKAYSNRSSPPSAAVPCLPQPRRRAEKFPTPSSTSPFKELTRGASNRRHHRGYLAGNELLRRQNSSTPAILRPRRPPRRVPGELPVLLDPSPFRLPRHSSVPGRPSPVTGSRSGWATPQPTRPV